MCQTGIDAACLRGKALLVRGLAGTIALPVSVELLELAEEAEAYAAGDWAHYQLFLLARFVDRNQLV
jgi:hypothetical protein